MQVFGMLSHAMLATNCCDSQPTWISLITTSGSPLCPLVSRGLFLARTSVYIPIWHHQTFITFLMSTWSRATEKSFDTIEYFDPHVSTILCSKKIALCSDTNRPFVGEKGLGQLVYPEYEIQYHSGVCRTRQLGMEHDLQLASTPLIGWYRCIG